MPETSEDVTTVGPRARRRADDSGFALVEVIVSITLLALLMLTVTGFFLKGAASASTMQRRQAATALADEAMELIRSVPAKGAPPSASLVVRGRSQAGVDAQWAQAAAAHPSFASAYLSSMTRVWDPTAATADPKTVPYSWTATVSDQPYRVDAFLGTCTRATASAAQCTPTGSGATAYRAVVLVTWTSPRNQACAGGCSFVLASLIDPQPDQVFMVNGGSSGGAAPVARPDAFTTAYGTQLGFNVRSNDSGSLGATPVTLLTLPLSGTLTPSTGASSGSFSYTPGASWCGSDTFRYLLTDKAVPPRTSAADVSVRTLCPAPTLTNVPGYLCKNRAMTLRLLSSVPGSWGSYALAVGTSSFEGDVALSSTQPGYVYVAARNGFNGTGPWNIPITLTYPDGQVASAAINLVVDTDPTC